MLTNTQLHIGIIPDGNRRWAKRQTLKPWKGHEAGVNAFRDIIGWARKNPAISALTIWGFSTENWNRSEEEIRQLMGIFEKFLLTERTTFHKEKTRLIHSGRRDRIPKSLAQLLQEMADESNHYQDFTVNFALDYGGRDEIVRAINKITEPDKITEENFRQYLDHPEISDIDLIIRTSGEQRTSGFFPWQSVYAELVFIDKFFPDLKPTDLNLAVGEYMSRHRRFGS